MMGWVGGGCCIVMEWVGRMQCDGEEDAAV